MCIRIMLQHFQYSVVGVDRILLFASVPHTGSGTFIRLMRSVMIMFF